jgi:hypothetical protein
MADESTPNPNEVPKREPGVLIGVEWYKKGPVTLDEDEKRAFKDLCVKLQTREMAPRREQIIMVWKKRLFDRGFQHLLPQRNGGWQLPAIGSGYNPQDQDSRSMFVINIYASYRQIITSVMTREVPKAHFEPIDPDSDVDINAAEGAEKLEEKIERDNQMKSKMEDMSRFLWTDGLAVFHSMYVLDGQQFGYESEEEEAVPEDEDKISDEETDEQDEEADKSAEPEQDEAVGESSDGDSEESGESAESSEPKSRKPKGHEVIKVGGALEWKLPMKAGCLAECPWAQGNEEIDLQIARAKYPDVADLLKPASGGPGGDDIDRLARISVKLGMMENFNMTDNQVFDVTEQKTFFRPAAMLEVADDLMRESLIKKFPLGAYVIFCGETFCCAYNTSMDDHLSLVFANSGDGIHRPGLGDWVVPVQEILNNWLELANDYFTRGVPNRWMDNEMFNVKALRDQVNTVGATHPFDREPGVTMAEVIWEETPVQFPEQLVVFIEMFRGSLAQMLCGAVDALSGGGDTSATDTVGGMIVQRDQAIGRIGLPWRRIKEAICKVKLQAVRILANNCDDPIKLTGSEAVTIEMQTLRGDFYAFPDVDENFPVSHTERQNQLAKLFTDAVSNPTLGELLFTPDNLELFQRVNGMDDFTFQVVASRDKQLGEATILLEADPEPNPKIAQAQQQLKALQTTAIQAANSGQQPDPQHIQQAQQLQQAMASLPPMTSSVPVRYFDDHATELWVCTKILNSPKGREMANGDEDEQKGYANLELHAKEHEAALKEKQAAAQSQAPKPTKAPSISISSKDLPPKELAAATTAAGVPSNPADFEQAEVADAVAKHPANIVQ